MFNKDVNYWFVLKSTTDERIFTIKGKVIEENNFMVKIARDDGSEDIIPFVRIIDVNKAKTEQT